MLYIKKNLPSIDTQNEISKTKRDRHWRTVPEDDVDLRRDIFDQMDKTSIQQDLLREQHHLCAYCMRPISNTFEGIRVEHYIPLSEDKEKTLDYTNYLGVCFGGSEHQEDNEDKKSKAKPVLCCDAQKGSQRLEAINPLNEDIMDHIAYNPQGYIYFNGNSMYSDSFCQKAQSDIDNILHLNGLFTKDGDVVTWISDTRTNIVAGRQNALLAAKKILAKMGPLTSGKIDRAIQSLLDAPRRQPFVGVIIFKLKQAQALLRSNGQ